MSAEMRTTLVRMLGWIQHWQVDREHNLAPTEGSLAQAKEMIEAALRSGGAS